MKKRQMFPSTSVDSSVQQSRGIIRRIVNDRVAGIPAVFLEFDPEDIAELVEDVVQMAMIHAAARLKDDGHVLDYQRDVRRTKADLVEAIESLVYIVL